LPDGCYDIGVVGKEDPALLGYFFVTDPDGKFTAATFD